jgi:aspartyl-tRNA(Asn)/glutamyl-tRNA(Gln) amidotransferase subunit C
MPNPPAIDRTAIQHLADLARLHIPAERHAVLRERLERIVAAFSALQEGGAMQDAATAEGALPLRADVAEPPLPLAQVLANAPQQAGDCFVVPRVIDA